MCGRLNRRGGRLVHFVWLNLCGGLRSGIFNLNFGYRLSTVWYILVRTGNKAVRSWAAKSYRYIATKK